MLFFSSIEDEVCSFELSKVLKELGVMQRSLFFWQESPGGNVKLSYGQDSHTGEISKHLCTLSFEYSAFTTAELGEMLPYYFSSEKHSKEWRVGMIKKERVEFWGSGRKEADARASAKIYLLKNNINTL